jgi:hypothetical protein
MSAVSTIRFAGSTSRMKSPACNPQVADSMMLGVSPQRVENPPRLLATSAAHRIQRDRI